MRKLDDAADADGSADNCLMAEFHLSTTRLRTDRPFVKVGAYRRLESGYLDWGGYAWSEAVERDGSAKNLGGACSLVMAASNQPLWADAALSELVVMRQPGRVALLCGQRIHTFVVLEQLSRLAGVTAISLSELALTEPVATSERDLVARTASSAFLYDLEVVCWQPWFGLDPFRFLRACSRTHGVVAVWPGTVSGGVAEFSGPGRRDYVRSNASGATLLRTRTSHFPDEVPFSIERIP